MPEFKFKIGDVVRHKVSGPGGCRQVRFLVLAQQLHIGQGATDNLYVCRGVSRDGGFTSRLIDLFEEELVLSEPFTDKPAI